MQQVMLTQKAIEKFHQDLDNLGLIYPVAALAKATGYSKGNVSEYINKNKKPSAAFIKKFYEVFPVPESSKDVPASTSESEPLYRTDMLTSQIIYNLSEAGRQNAIAEKARAEAELLREQNTRKMMELISIENVPAGSPITFDAISGGLRELLVDLGMGKHWKSREEGVAAVRNKLYGQLKKKQVGGIQNG
jgi:transcriptional regulator with XRE-family HTH domain